MRRLTGKVAIVTGSSSGIGKAIALRFGGEGASVVIAARNAERSEETALAIRQKGGEARVIQTDIAHEDQVDALFERTVQECGRVDIAVHNAGIFGGSTIAETPTKAFDEVIRVNLRGTFLCCRAAFKQMKKQGGGIIINVSSVAGVQAWAGTGSYSASKHGVMAPEPWRMKAVHSTSKCLRSVREQWRKTWSTQASLRSRKARKSVPSILPKPPSIFAVSADLR